MMVVVAVWLEKVFQQRYWGVGGVRNRSTSSYSDFSETDICTLQMYDHQSY